MYTATPKDVIDFWLKAGPDRWFAQDRDFDARLRWEFYPAQQSAAFGDLDSWQETPEGALALILLLDQFPRNIFRGVARAFATDGKAREVARRAIERGFDRQIEAPLKQFFYVPLMHSEAIEDQDFCVAKFREAQDENGAKWAEVHRDIIAQFGRFPHRNIILGRTTTMPEKAFLDGGGFAG